MIIPGFSRYDITEDGVVTRVADGSVVKHMRCRDSSGKEYMKVGMRADDGRWSVCNVIRLLAITFMPIDDVFDTSIASTKDGDFSNTVLSNVVWRSRSEMVSDAWKAGKLKHRAHRNPCYCEASVEMVYDTLAAYSDPVTMVELSHQLQVPYTVIRYSMLELIKAGRAKKTPSGYEVI